MSIKGFNVNGTLEKYDYNELDNKPSGITVDSALSNTSQNPVQNRIVTAAIETLSNVVDQNVYAISQNASAIQTLGNTKLSTNQGVANVGKFMVVGSDGVVSPVAMSAWQGGSY